jgi:large subunit ribosomal protein L6
MSKIGRLPIEIKDGTTVTITGSDVSVSGTKGNMSYTLPKGITAEIVESKVVLTPERTNDRVLSAYYGLARAQLANMVKGVSAGFEKKLELIGVGYRAQMQGNDLVLSLGFSHPVRISPKSGISIAVAENVVTVSGIDKMLVGEVAANIRSVKKPEPYKGKGIKYAGEQIRRKAGKAAKAVGAK